MSGSHSRGELGRRSVGTGLESHGALSGTTRPFSPFIAGHELWGRSPPSSFRRSSLPLVRLDSTWPLFSQLSGLSKELSGL